MLGPTASGKSEVALELASRHRIPILSVDSMQVYREMDIGTAKPTAADRARVDHHLLDLVDPEQEFSVAEFQEEARSLLAQFEDVFLVGGSGLHFRSIVDPLEFPPTDPELRQELEQLPNPIEALVEADPGARERVDLDNPRRVVRALEIFELTGQTPSAREQRRQELGLSDYRPLLQFRAVGLDPFDSIGDRIATRTETMRLAGLWEEVGGLLNRLGRTAKGAVGYQQLTRAHRGELGIEEAWDETRRATVRLAKRQRTYFRRDPRIDWRPWADSVAGRVSDAALALGLR